MNGSIVNRAMEGFNPEASARVLARMARSRRPTPPGLRDTRCPAQNPLPWIASPAYSKLHQILASRRQPVSHALLREKLECSRAMATRIIEEMRNFLGAPIEYDRPTNGYRYTHQAFDLPGLWFNASELYALLAVQKHLAEVQPGFLDGMLGPLKGRIERILQSEQLGSGEITRRVRILRMAGRSTAPSSQGTLVFPGRAGMSRMPTTPPMPRRGFFPCDQILPPTKAIIASSVMNAVINRRT